MDVSDGGKAATFSSYGWSLVEKRKYYLYYPYNDSYFKNDTPITNLPITFDGQMQSGNNSLSHIATYDYMIGEGITDDNSADFKLNHLCSVIRIEYVSPKSAVYTNVALRTTDNVFCRTAEMNLETQSINPTGKDSYASLRLDRIEVEEGETLVAYLVVAPLDLTGWDVKLAIATEDGDEVEFDVQANELRAGKLYLLNTTEIVEKSLSAKRRASSLQEPSVSTYDIPIDTGSEIVVTGIQQTKQNQTQGSETLYTLSGIRTRESSAKGILIKNGKKVIIH